MKLPSIVFNFETFKKRSRRTLLWVSVGLTILVAILRPHWALPFAWGTVLGYGYFLSLFLSAEGPKNKAAAGLFMVRMVGVAVLMVVLGQFQLQKICLVLLGFLSYKIVLVLEVIRAGIGHFRISGK